MLRILLIYVLVISFVSIFFAPCFANEKIGEEDKDFNQLYLKTYDDKIIVRPFLSFQQFEFDIISKEKGSSRLTFKPNGYLNAGFGLSSTKYGIGLSISSSIPRPIKDTEIYGKSDYFDMRFKYYGRKVGCDIYAYQYKGFYLNREYFIDNPEKLIPPWEPERPYPQYSGLLVRGLDIGTYYIFNGEQLSLASSFNQTERQFNNSGSILLMLSFTHLNIKSDSLLIPSDERKFYGNYATFKIGQFNSLILSPGIAYTIVFKNFYVTPVIFIGPGIQQQIIRTEEMEMTVWNYTYKLNARISAGYNSDTYFIGLHAHIDSTRIMSADRTLTIVPRLLQYKVYAGYKF